MRKMIFVLGVLVMCVSACSKEELSERSRTVSREEEDPGEWTPDSYVHDTTVYFTAVEVPQSYDWRRDTLGGVFEGKLILFKNFRRELELEVGPSNEISPEYDSHHIIGGHLYTVFRSDNSTVVKRDGNTILHTVGRETLKGMQPTGGGIYTLCARDSGNIFILRLDGKTLLEFNADGVYGSMTEDSSGPTGALYIDCGKLYFCYRATVAGAAAYYVVENGHVRALTPPVNQNEHSIRDIKVENGCINYFTVSDGKAYLFRDGRTEIYENENPKFKYYDGRLLRNRRMSTAIGEYRYASAIFGRTLFYYPIMKLQFSFSTGMFVIPGDGGASLLINRSDKTHQTVIFNSSGGTGIKDRTYCFSNKCSYSLGTRIYLALTPCEQGRKPYVWVDKDTTEVSVNGYLTAISVKDSVTTIPGGYRCRQR